MDLDARYPAVSDLKVRARRRIPKFLWEFLDSATGSETTPARTRRALDQIQFMPSILHGELEFDLGTKLLGRDYAAPFGISPVGMSGLIWPDAEVTLARAARRLDIPFGLSTVATRTPESLARQTDGRGWFQLYPPRDEAIRQHMLDRMRDSGFDTLVLTVDVPVASRRERQVRAGLTNPPRLTPRLAAQIAMRPAWAAATLARWPLPHMATLDAYVDGSQSLSSTAHVGYLLRASPDWAYLQWLRDRWDGPLVVKGVLNPEDAPKLQGAGVDALWVSNHAGRQFDGAPLAINLLPAIRAATTLPLIYDGGVEGGLDLLRAIARGADFVMLGRAWHYALAALGRDGPQHLFDILCRDLRSNMGQLGLSTPFGAHEWGGSEPVAALPTPTS